MRSALLLLAGILLATAAAGCEDVGIAGPKKLKNQPVKERGWAPVEALPTGAGGWRGYSVLLPPNPVMGPGPGGGWYTAALPDAFVGVVTLEAGVNAAAASPDQQRKAVDRAIDAAATHLRLTQADLTRSDSNAGAAIGRLATGSATREARRPAAGEPAAVTAGEKADEERREGLSLTGAVRATLRGVVDGDRVHVQFALRTPTSAVDSAAVGEFLQSFEAKR